MFDFGVIPESPDEQYEVACQKVANLLDDPGWFWLKWRIADENLSWPKIMDIVADNIS